jgi:hypothetical protein
VAERFVPTVPSTSTAATEMSAAITHIQWP